MMGVGGGAEEKCRLPWLADNETLLKKTLAKTSYSSPQNSEIWTKIKMIQNLTFGVLFWKKLFRSYNFFVFVHTFQWTSSEFFLISDFLTGSLKANKN